MQSSSSSSISSHSQSGAVVNRLSTDARPGKLPPIDQGNRSSTPTMIASRKVKTPELATCLPSTSEYNTTCNLPSLPSTAIKTSKACLDVSEPSIKYNPKLHKVKDSSASFLNEDHQNAHSISPDTFNDVIPPPTPPNKSVLEAQQKTKRHPTNHSSKTSAPAKEKEKQGGLENVKVSRTSCCRNTREAHHVPQSPHQPTTSRSLVAFTFKQFRSEVDKWKKSKKSYKLQEFYRSAFDSFKSINDTFKKQRSSIPCSSTSNSEKSASHSSTNLPEYLLDSSVQQKFVGFVYETLLQMSQEIQKLVLKGIINCLLNEWKSEKTESDLRAYFILLQNPMFARIDTYVVYAHLLRQIATLNERDQHILTHWLRRLSTPRFRPLVERLHQFVTLRLFPGQSDDLPPMTNCGWWIPSAVKVLSLMNNSNNLVKPRLVSYREFYNHTLDHIDVMAEFRQWENPASHSGFTFCHFPFVLSLVAKLRILKHDQERQMIRTARDELVQTIRRRPSRAPNVNQLFFNISVRRQHMLQDSLEQIFNNRKHLKKKLRVEFVGEPGYDMGGLTKEWFLLLLRKVLSPEYNTFVYHEKARCYWFADNASENSSDLFLVGVLMGLAVYNCITLDIRLPMVCYRKLLSSVPRPGSPLSHAADQCSTGPSKPQQTTVTSQASETPASNTPVGVIPVTLEDYRSIDPDMVHGLEQLLSYEGDVQEDFDYTFQTSQTDFGTLKTVQLKPGGDKIPVTNKNRHEYVQAFLNFKLNKAVYRQFLAFHHGFYTVCCSNALSFLCAEELETLVCGNSGFDLRDLMKYTTYKGFVPNDPTIIFFWDVLFSLSRDLQKQFLHFATGSDRVPVGGMQELNFKIVRTPTAQNMLPMAHTCFNQLLLPPYGSKQQLENKLVIAISNAEGFGLQ
uniref:HECT-type E3 ubiquitin transferase n=1 Tax=Phallusia mammillata TaxID=59560 RepID=A0A6F9DDR1_9ASCI|nr:probable E3 ubiquitin-protein ligase HECTD2 [Phallusia mammillata]